MSETKKKMPTLEQLKAKKKAHVTKCLIPLDSEVVEKWNDMLSNVKILELQLRDRPTDAGLLNDLATANEKLEDYRPTFEDNIVEFTFQSLGRVRLDALQDEHPPTRAQRDDFEKERKREIAAGNKDAASRELAWDPDKFPLALISESMIQPKGSPEELLQWLNGDEWGAAELATMFGKAMEANNTMHVVRLGKD